MIQNYIGTVEPLYACGGIMNSPVFRIILPSVLGKTVRTYSDNEATALGAWISAAVTLGFVESYQSAFEKARDGTGSCQSVDHRIAGRANHFALRNS